VSFFPVSALASDGAEAAPKGQLASSHENRQFRPQKHRKSIHSDIYCDFHEYGFK
jgi:hypothetical protein